MVDDYARRLSLAMGAGGERPTTQAMKDLASALGVTYQAVAKLWSDSSKAFTAYNNSIAAEHLQVDPDWLATGKGTMRSAKVWPFGATVTPEVFFQLDQATVQSAIDVIESAVHRMARAKAAPSAPPRPAGTHNVGSQAPARTMAEAIDRKIHDLENGGSPAAPALAGPASGSAAERPKKRPR